MSNVIDRLQERGFIDAMTSEELRHRVNQPIKIYCGFDPTADSLHLGHLVPIIALRWFQEHGHTPVAVVGGATGMIGDPSGRSQERSLLDESTIAKNVLGIQKNLEMILDPHHPTAKPIFLNNYDWFKNFSFVDFLRDVGKYFRLGPMLAKESVRSRLKSEEGMSFTEFSYQLLQAYDFYHLHHGYDVTLQMGGSDQWGNITAGIDLIRKMGRGGVADGITFPLLTRSDGQKFGKSEKGAVWLSPDKLSPYEFYQYLFRVPDDDVIKLMRLLTFMDMAAIQAYEFDLKAGISQPNAAQKRLAEEVTLLVHGEEGVKMALKVTQGAAPGSNASLDVHVLEALATGLPTYQLARDEVLNVSLIDLLVKVRLQASKGDARRMLLNGGIYLNNQKIEGIQRAIAASDLIGGRLLLLAAGKKNKLLIQIC